MKLLKIEFMTLILEDSKWHKFDSYLWFFTAYVKKPSFKWIAQMMRGIMVTYCYDKAGNFLKSNISNISKIHKKVINLFGGSAIKIYKIA